VSAIKLAEATVSFLVETLKAEVSVAKRWVKSRDMLRADGVTSEVMDADEDFRKTFKAEVIMLSFTVAEQKIMAKPHTALSDEEKVTKRWVQQQLGSRYAKVQAHVKKAEDEEKETEEERGARRVADMATRLKRDLVAWTAKVEKAEKVTFSAVEMVKCLKAASALIK
jgi:hypothetical protein